MKTARIAVFAAMLCCLWNPAVHANDEKQQAVQQLTRSYQKDGWDGLTFKVSEKSKSTVVIHQPNINQNKPLTPGQLTTLMGAILEPRTVGRLRKAGFTKGEFLDGALRKYDFEVSRRYHGETQQFFKKLANGR